jgi:hypothetical protein
VSGGRERIREMKEGDEEGRLNKKVIISLCNNVIL